jgi:hypothetical protein
MFSLQTSSLRIIPVLLLVLPFYIINGTNSELELTHPVEFGQNLWSYLCGSE